MDFVALPGGASVFITGILLSFVAGCVFAWLLFRVRSSREGANLRVEFETERTRLSSDLANAQRAFADQKVEIASKEGEISSLNDRLLSLASEKAAFETSLQNERNNTQEKILFLNDAQRNLTDAFAALSRQALDQNNQSFVNQATEVFKQFQSSAVTDLKQRQEKISEIVMPVQKSLEAVDNHIAQLEKERLNTFATIGEQIHQMTSSQLKLSETTLNLVSILRNTRTRGQWGEIQLRRIVELAGMSQHCDFREQFHVVGEDGAQRPDMVVNLPAKRTIVIDAKAPMTAFLEAFDATDDDSRNHHFRKHARSLRMHVGLLSKKAYHENFDPSPEFVLMFLPNEAVFSAALEHDPDLLDFGVSNNVIIATPLTLIVLLKSAAYGWRQEAIAEDVRQVAVLGRRLYERIGKMAMDVAKVGQSIDRSAKAYNKMVGSMEARVLSSARKFKDLPAIGSNSDLQQLESVETVSRSFRTEEMIANNRSGGLESNEDTRPNDIQYE
jgi:DNA recombination protein RmuC